MTDITLQHQLRQELSPQLLQSVKLLQMNSQELTDYLNRLREENPLLETEDSHRREYEALRRKVSWLDAGPAAQAYEELRERGRPDRETQDLRSFLLDQLDRTGLSRECRDLCRYLACLVDENGYLDREDLPRAVPGDLLDEAMSVLQSLDPPGVGAGDLSQCLLLQLRRKKKSSDLALEIVKGFLPQLGQRRYGAIAKALGVKEEAVRSAAEEIAALEPRPGQAFQAEEETLYVRPDVFVAEIDGQWQILLNDYYLPRFQISSYYTRLLEESEDRETRTYLKEKMRQAQWVLEGLERRGTTLRRCAQAVLEAQKPFFTGTTWELAPMSMAALAEKLELHPSTVTRAIQGKYLQCRRGTYPLKYFFSPAIGQGPSQQAVKCRLLELIKEEDPKHPLSDQTLCDALNAGGAGVSRRTVAKYRAQMGVSAAWSRRKE